MPKRILSGVVENNSLDKTIVVRVERRFIDPLLKKTVRRSKKNIMRMMKKINTTPEIKCVFKNQDHTLNSKDG
jgi:ribosomal protein S17